MSSEHAVEQNAGRCDLCRKPIDMSSGDQLVMQEFGAPDDVLRRADLERYIDSESGENDE